MEKHRVEQRIRHEEKKERKGQESSEEEEETESRRRELVPKKDSVSKLKTRYYEHRREQIIKAISRTREKEVAIDAGGNKSSLYTLHFTLLLPLLLF